MVFEFSGILLRAADNQRKVSVEATTLNGGLAELTSRFPQMKKLLLDNAGHLRRAHRVVLNDELISQPDSTMALAPGDRVAFFTAVAGG